MNKKVVKLKIILSYLCIGVIILMVFTGVVAHAILKNGKGEVNDYLSNNNDNVYKATNMLLESVYLSMYDSYANDDVILQALYANELNPFERQEVYKNLNRMVKSSPILESIYIYNKQQNLIFSSLSTPQSQEDFYESNLFDEISQFHKKQTIFLVRDVQLNNTTLNYDTKVMSFVFSESSGNPSDSSMMIVNISQSKLNKNIYKNFIPGDSMESLIIDDEGVIISHLNEERINGNIGDESYTKEILTSEEMKDSFTGNIDGKEYIISYTKSNKWGCTFVSMASFEELLSEVYSMIRIIGIFAAIFILISILTALYFTKTIYSPINKLVQEASGLGNLLTNNYSNEYDYVLYAIENMKNEIGSLEDKVSSYYPAKKNNLLKRMLNGNSVSELELINNSIRLEGPAYTVIVLRIDSFRKLTESIDMSEIISHRNNLIQMACEYLSEEFIVENVEDGLEYIPIIINISNDRIKWLVELKEVIKTIQLDFKNTYDLSFSTGIGMIVFSIKALRCSFRDAVEATNYRIIYGNDAIITNQDYRSAKLCEYTYPIHIEKKILDNLKLSRKNNLMELIGDFTEEVKGYEYNEILLSYSQLVLVIVRTARQINYSTNKSLRINYIDMQNRLNNCNTLDGIEEVVYELLIEIINRQERVQSNKNTEMINRVMELIINNYNSAELSVEMIADTEHLSVNYLRNIFKSEVGTSLSDYINQVRFEKAKQYLTETDYPAKRIASMCGFHSNDYFYYAFKKFTGMSPTVYRKNI